MTERVRIDATDLPDLSPDEVYEFALRPRNAAGTGEPSARVQSLPAAIRAARMARILREWVGVDDWALANAIIGLRARTTQDEAGLITEAGRVDRVSAQIEEKAGADALNALDVRVHETEQGITVQASELTRVAAEVAGKAASTAIQLLESEVEDLDDRLTTMSAATTALISAVAGKAAATAVQGLQTRIEELDGRTVAAASSVIELRAELPSIIVDEVPRASAEVLSVLEAEVEAHDGLITANADDITALESTVTGKADATAVQALTTRVTTAENDIDGAETDISTNASAITALRSSITGKADASALMSLETRVDTNAGTIASQASSITNLNANVDGKASATALSTLEARVTADETGTEATALWAVQTQVDERVGGVGLINDGTKVRFYVVADRFAIIPPTSRTSANITQVDSSSDIPSSPRNGQYLVFRAQVSMLTGFVDTDGSSPLTQAAIGQWFERTGGQWQRLRRPPPLYTNSELGTITSASRIVPFIVDGGSVYINDALINNATITTAMIQDAAITSAKIGEAAIAFAQIDQGDIFDLTVGNKIESEALTATQGFRFLRDGTFILRGGEFRGTIKSDNYDGKDSPSDLTTAEVGTVGWLLNQNGKLVVDAAFIRGELQSNQVAENVRASAVLYQGSVTTSSIATIALPANVTLDEFDSLLIGVEGATAEGRIMISSYASIGLLVNGTASSVPSSASQVNFPLGSGSSGQRQQKIWKKSDDTAIYLRRNDSQDTVTVRSVIAFRDPKVAAVVITTDTDHIWRRASTKPSAPSGGTSTLRHSPSGWGRVSVTASATQDVYRAERTRSYRNGIFTSATNWGNVTKIADRTGTANFDISGSAVVAKGTDSGGNAAVTVSIRDDVPAAAMADLEPGVMSAIRLGGRDGVSGTVGINFGGVGRTTAADNLTDAARNGLVAVITMGSRTVTARNFDTDLIEPYTATGHAIAQTMANNATAGDVMSYRVYYLTTITDTDYVYRLATSAPSAPSGGTSTEAHEPSGWDRDEPEPSATQDVYRAERTRTFTSGSFTSATTWTKVTKIAERTGSSGGTSPEAPQNLSATLSRTFMIVGITLREYTISWDAPDVVSGTFVRYEYRRRLNDGPWTAWTVATGGSLTTGASYLDTIGTSPDHVDVEVRIVTSDGNGPAAAISAGG